MNREIRGAVALLTTYLIWGAMPIYWRALGDVSSTEILAHRVLWSLVFTFVLVSINGSGRTFMDLTMGRKRDFLWLGVGGFLITFNWGLYIWAVNHGRVLETSLGYFINPLLSMFFGMVFFKERLNRVQTVALFIAVLGVAAEVASVGTVPVVSLSLALSFALYGVLKKAIRVRPDRALLAETLTAAPFALAWLLMLQRDGAASFPYDPATNALLLGAGVVTSVPLLLFAYGAARVPLVSLGFFQYATPMLSFSIGVFLYGESVCRSRVITFLFIWCALALYSAEALFKNRWKQSQGSTNTVPTLSDIPAPCQSGDSQPNKEYLDC